MPKNRLWLAKTLRREGWPNARAWLNATIDTFRTKDYVYINDGERVTISFRDHGSET